MDNANKKCLESVSAIPDFWEKNSWTLIDLRPIRESLESNKMVTNKSVRFEIQNYDFYFFENNDFMKKKSSERQSN